MQESAKTVRSIKISFDEISFLNETCDINVMKMSHRIDEISTTFILLLQNEELESICEKLTDTFVRIGTSNGEVNSMGLHIENLIDRFNDYD
jgi:hypothetical protein